ncbi:unnamed protein product [Rotaria sp. Silwood2]|nr:unnamed protein product [Rotaria sp. Silwood2]CAF4781638.1 unnamed protein product [Rotaria sp. Silwood2]
MNAIERDYHLHEGQEREIIMKLWLKGQTMISIIQCFRYLLQDLNIDDKDFSERLKVSLSYRSIYATNKHKNFPYLVAAV